MSLTRLPRNFLQLRFYCAQQSSAAQQQPTEKKIDVFLNPTVQEHLQKLTGLDYDKVFRVRRRGQSIAPPTYKFVTAAQLEKMKARAKARAMERLQMPPVMDERVPVNKVLSEDPEIRGYEKAKMVFTDITYGVHDRNRIIVVREPDGRLREAEWEERDRMNQIYFPTEGRRIVPPKMFEPEKLREVLGPEKYEYILDVNCVQFEPDHPVHIQTQAAVFDHIYETGSFSTLYSTRHCGPMVFYYVWNKTCDDLLLHFLRNKDVSSAESVLKVFGQVHPGSVMAKTSPDVSGIDLMRLYIENDAVKASKLKMTLEAMLEAEEEAKRAQEAREVAHGAKSDE